MFKFSFILLCFLLSLTGCEKAKESLNQTPVNSSSPISSSTPINNNPNLNNFNLQSPVTLEGMGSIKIGMTIKEAEKAGKVTFKKEGSGGEEGGCFYYSIAEIEKILVMIIDNKIARIDINNSLVKTKEGIGIGDTEAKIKTIYKNKIKEEVHKYVEGGKYLILIPDQGLDQNYSIIFETDNNGNVTTFRSGKFPEVGYVEGCA